MGSVLVAFSSDTKTGCGSQHLRRCRLHLAGRGPNNSSLLRQQGPTPADGLRRNYQPAARANSKLIK